MRRLHYLIISLTLLSLAGVTLWWMITPVNTPVQQIVAPPSSAQSQFLPLPLIGVVGLLTLGFVIWIWALIHMLLNPRLGDNERIVWTLLIIFLHLLGAILYFFIAAHRRPSSPTAPHP